MSDDWRGCAALCLELDAQASWPPGPGSWLEGRDLEHLVAAYDASLPEGWDAEVDWYLESPEAHWCLGVLRRRVQKNEEDWGGEGAVWEAPDEGSPGVGAAWTA